MILTIRCWFQFDYSFILYFRTRFLLILEIQYFSLFKNVHLLTLEMLPTNPLTPNTPREAILRLEHFYENGEDEELSQPATVDLVSVFTYYVLVS
jgi:hypothetical protein